MVRIMLCLISGLLSWSCTSSNKGLEILVKNPTTKNRSLETVSISTNYLSSLQTKYTLEDIVVENEEGEVLVRQLIDNNQDGTIDELLFQTQLKASAEKKFYVKSIPNGRNLQPDNELTTYSRLVPERTDDYTWENDLVAFRTFGMEAQRRVEVNEPGGTLSSGIDLWLKRVNYSIIDAWYKKNLDSIGYYHIDHGEGYDPYHVGKSRGAGGIGIWENDSLYTSKNFVDYRTLATGPIRTIFELDYAPWSDYQIKETKRISLDLGSNFSKITSFFQYEKMPPNYTIGITLHEGEGEINLKKLEGWFRYWEAINDSFLGEGIVVDPKLVEEAISHISNTPDQSQILIITKPDSELTYYAGFGWQKSGQVSGKKDWDILLQRKAEQIKHPLQVQLK